MTPSLVKALSSAAAVLPALTGATLTSSNKTYKVSEIYDASNFFDKFDFVSIPDPTGGYVQYQERAAAEKLGLVRREGGEIYLGVEHGAESVLNFQKDTGRKSVRLESKTVYNRGLVVAEFSHLPRPTCGSWPAFWFFGEPWPTKGEIDLYENWNDLFFNRHTSHVDNPSVVGDCVIAQDDMSAVVDAPNCFDFAQGQADFQGCSASDFSTTFGSASGGVYAMEWTSEHLKIWQWERALAPADVKSGNPQPSAAWGLPAYAIKQCNVDKAFRDMKMVLNLNFCGVAAQDAQWGASCSASTTFDTCAEYVAAKPGDFADTFFKVKDIKFYELSDEAPISSSTASVVSSAASSATSVATSSTVPSITTSGSDASATDGSNTSSYPTDGQFTNISSSGVPATGYPTQEPPATTEGPGPESTTSTIYTTSVGTITSCAADVPDCPEKGQLTTEIISVGVTVCPVTEAETGTKTATSPAQPAEPTTATTKAPELPSGGNSVPSGGNGVPSTISVTRVHTITSCPPTVLDCPVGSVTTEIEVKTTIVESPVGGGYPTDVPDTDKPTGETPVPVGSGPGCEDCTTTLRETTIESTAVPQGASSASSAIDIPGVPGAPGVPTNPTTTLATATGVASTDGSTEEVVEVTATIVPIPAASGFTNTTDGYPTVAPPPPQGTGAFGFPNGPTENIVEVSGGVRVGASAALMAIAGFFFFAM